MKILLIKIMKILMTEKSYKFLKTEIDYLNQKKNAKNCNKLIKLYYNNQLEKIEINKKKNLKTEKIIWQFWGQGWDYEKLPEIVKLSYKSIERYKGDYTVIRLDEKSIENYVALPKFLWNDLKNKRISYALFSDVLRLVLLDKYGGIWLDSDILLTNFIPKFIEESDYFLFQRTKEAKNKEEWLNFDNYFFSWNKRHKIKIVSGIIKSRKDNILIHSWSDLLLILLKNKKNKKIHYYIIQILYNELIEGKLKTYNCNIVDDTLLHELMKVLYNKFSQEEYLEILKKVDLHILSEKRNKTNIEGSFYDYLKKEFKI